MNKKKTLTCQVDSRGKRNKVGQDTIVSREQLEGVTAGLPAAPQAVRITHGTCGTSGAVP